MSATSSQNANAKSLKWSVRRAALTGAFIGCPFWMATGVLCAYLLMFLIIVLLAPFQVHYMPYSGSVQQDAWILAKWMAVLAVLPGIFGGAILGIAVNNTGIPGEPKFWTLVERCGCLPGVVLHLCKDLFRSLFSRKDMGGIDSANRFASDPFSTVNEVWCEVNSSGLNLVWIEIVLGYLIWSGLDEVGPSRYMKLMLGLFIFFFLGYFLLWGYRTALDAAKR